VLWLERDSPIIRGGDFLVTRKLEGRVRGSVLGSDEEISDALLDELARTVARLHSLAPLTELGSEVESLDSRLWRQSITEVGAAYVRGFYDFYLATPSIPQPALTAMFGWMLNNLPRCEEQPVLVHGDIGFQNFLVHENRVTCVLDWEFAHAGDPAEDIGYIRNALGGKIDWNRFMTLYREYGGRAIDEQRIRFYQVWGYMRNSVGCALSGHRFASGEMNEVKLAIVPYMYIQIYIRRCLDYIRQ
jgi:aminoglycoside phosphotransferase (APT) family kinase protein